MCKVLLNMYILTGYWVLGIVSLDQLSGACHTHICYHDKFICSKLIQGLKFGRTILLSPKFNKIWLPLVTISN